MEFPRPLTSQPHGISNSLRGGCGYFLIQLNGIKPGLSQAETEKYFDWIIGMIWLISSIFRLVTAQQQMKSESEASFSSLEVCCCCCFRIFEAISEFPQAWDHAVSLLSLYMSLTPCALLKKKKRKTSDRRLSFPKSLLSAKPLVWKVFFSWCKWNSLSQERFGT